MDNERLKPVLEALFAASDKPLSVNQLFELFVGDIDQPGKDDIRKAIEDLTEKYQQGGIELKQVASGFRSAGQGRFRNLGCASMGTKTAALFARVDGNPGVDRLSPANHTG